MQHEGDNRSADSKNLQGTPVTRRDFLKIAGAGAAAVGIGAGFGGALAGCGGGGDDSSGGGGGGSSSEPIKFGIMGTMGDAAGQNIVRCTEIMFKQINASGGILGRKCEIVGPIDDHSETSQAINGFESMVSQGVNVILGGSIDDVESALLSRIARAPDVLYLSMFASTQAFMENVYKDYENYKNYFMYTPTDLGLYMCCQNPAVDLKNDYGWTKVQCLREDMVWTEGIEQYFRDLAPKAGLEVTGVSVVPVDVEDLTPYFHEAEKNGAQVLMTFISVFGERLALQAYENKVPLCVMGHNGILNDYGYWERSNGAWGSMATTSNWGSLEKHTQEWRDFVTEWFTTYTDDPRTPMWLGEANWRGIKSYKEACERAGSIETEAVIPELEKTYYPDAPTRGGFYGDGEGEWPHAWCSPIDPEAAASENPKRGKGLWESSPYEPMTEWVPADQAPEGTYVLPTQPEDYGRLITVYPVHLQGGKYIPPEWLKS
jgi:ABC-type branched-subunit amino acid transport system substrate-binding protein